MLSGVFLVSVSIAVVAEEICRSAEDCSLLGDCVKGACVCDKGFKGSKCGQLDLLAADRHSGYRNASMSSWCGSSVYDGEKYHFFGSGMSFNCPLANWSTNSMSIHATATSPAGPYAFQEIVAPEFAHNTAIRRGADGRYYLFNIGKDMHGKNVHHCKGDLDTSSQGQSAIGSDSPSEPSPQDFIRLASAATPQGPWKFRIIMHSEPSRGPHRLNCNKSNPSGIIFQNGSILMMYRGEQCGEGFFGKCKNSTHNWCERQFLAFAESADAPFVDRQGDVSDLAGNEDAFLWQGPRGFHALLHSKNACGQDASQVNVCGSIAFSRDSWHWTLNQDPAYDGSMAWKNADGTVTKDFLLSRQRPNILFYEDGMTPRYLINGVQEQGVEKEYTLFVPFDAGDASQPVIV